MFTDPTVTDFKNYFTRDFPYGTDPNTSILDSDITKALAEAGFNFNSALISDQSEYTLTFLYLTAHYLCMDLQASSQGIQSQYNWMTTGKSVGSVNESFAIPERILSNPQLAMISKTRYGAKYISLIWPRMIGQIFTVPGVTKP